MKVAVITAGMGFVFAAVMGGLLFSRNYRLLRAAVVSQQQFATSEVLGRIDAFLYERERDIEGIADDEYFETFDSVPAERLQSRLGEWARHSGPWYELWLADMNGKIVSSDHDEFIDRPIPDDADERRIFERALEGATVYSDAVPSDMVPTPTLLMATPVRSHQPGRPIVGVIVAAVAWPPLEELLRLMPTDEVHLLSRDGRVIGGRDSQHEEAYFQPQHPFADGDAGVRTTALEPGYLSYSGSGWRLEGVTESAKSTWPAIESAGFLAAGLVGLAVTLIVLLSVFLHWSVVAPLMRLSRGISGFAGGDMRGRVPVEGKDEVGKVAEAFNVMAGRIQALTDGLEKNVKERTAALEKEMLRSRAVFESQVDGVIITTLDRVIVDMNVAALEMFGFTFGEVIGRPTRMLHVDDAHYERFGREMLAKEASGTSPRVEFDFRAKDGRIFPVDFGFSYLFGQGGEKIGRIGILRDITLRRRQEAKLKDLDALKNKFIQIVSHQLRTPLNAIRWNLETLLAEELGKLKKEQKEFLRITYEADIEVISRIHDLLTAMDIEEGRVPIVKEEVAIDSIWNSVMSEWKKRCMLKDLDCRYEPSPQPLPAVEADTEKLRDVFWKFVDNAVTYTKPKGKIRAALVRAGDVVRFEVIDEGVGIPEVEQGRVFTRFFRASNAATMKPDASGLGLYIARYFVEQYGGRAGFSSKEGRGSTFWFELPVAVR